MQPPSEALVCARPEDGRARAVVMPGETGELLEVALTPGQSAVCRHCAVTWMSPRLFPVECPSAAFAFDL